MTRDYAIKYLEKFPEDDYLICVVFSKETVKEWLKNFTVDMDEVIDRVNDTNWSYDMEFACQEIAYEIIGECEK